MRVRSASATLAAAAATVLLVLAARSAAAPAGPSWARLCSPNFTLEGNVPESGLRVVARRFEQFREVLNRLLPTASLITPTPLTVVVFAYDRDFKPVRPLFDGRPIEAASNLRASAGSGVGGGDGVGQLLQMTMTTATRILNVRRASIVNCAGRLARRRSLGVFMGPPVAPRSQVERAA